MNSLSQLWTKVNQWSQKIPTKALNSAYQSALAIKNLEDQHFQGNMISPALEGGQSVYEYYKSALDRELVKINFNLTQLRVSNFLNIGKTSSKSNAPQPSDEKADREILEKLRFIETVIGKYRKQQEQELIAKDLSAKPLNSEPRSPLSSFENINQESSTVLGDIETSLQQNRPSLRGRKLTAEYEEEFIGELRRLRQQRKISWRILVLLLLVPLLVQVLTKNVIYGPIIDRLKVDQVQFEQIKISEEVGDKFLAKYRKYKDRLAIEQLIEPDFNKSDAEELLKEKTKELLLEAGYESKDGLVNILADLTSLLSFVAILYFRRHECLIAVNFLSYNFLGLNVVTQVFIFILLTDMFVGFHSAEGWEVILNKTFEHLGIAENPNFNGLFIATIPVMMDSIFKLLIFNYFTRKSPASVAILEKMNQ